MRTRDKIITLSGFALFIIALVWTVLDYRPKIPKCPYPADVIVGNGKYDPSTLYWSEYHCVSEQGFTRQPKPRSGDN